MSSAPLETAPSDRDEFALTWWRLRFVHRETEARFRRYQAQQAIPYTRVGMVSSIANWVAIIAGSTLAIPERSRPLVEWSLFCMIPLCSASIVITYRPKLARWLFPLTMFVNCLTGCSLALFSFYVLERLDVAFGACLIVPFFGFTIFRLRTSQAVAAVLPYMILNQVLVLTSSGNGGISPARADIIIFSVACWVAFTSGLMACVVLELLSREGFRQERIIDAQRRVLEFERARSESLLLNVLPEAIAHRLKSERRIADHFPEVTVLFGDIVGFTVLSQRLPPSAIVDALDEIFSAFDDMAERHGLEKIKTIGDAYMVVGGLPAPRPDHAEAVAEMALEMRDLFLTRRFAGGEQLRMRIGIHTGPVVAGVIGKKKFIYDLWGDTVNTASRMESHGVESTVQVTEAAWERLRHRFDLSPRGVVQVKGKGEMPTWFLDRRKPSP